jgi:endo-chitodextinase
VQFNDCDGGKVLLNLVTNDPTRSRCEDAISTYKSRNIEIAYNYINGGGPSQSGGGIMLGDGGERTYNVYVHDNILVNPGQYGIALNAGNNMRIINNKVYSRQLAWSNVGIYTWRKDKDPAQFHSNEISGNQVVWVSKSGNRNDYWFSSETLPFLKRENNVNAGPSESMTPPPGCGIIEELPPEPEPCEPDTVYIDRPYPVFVVDTVYLPKLDTITIGGVDIGITILRK